MKWYCLASGRNCCSAEDSQNESTSSCRATDFPEVVAEHDENRSTSKRTEAPGIVWRLSEKAKRSLLDWCL